MIKFLGHSWHALPVDTVFQYLQASTQGLSAHEAKNRLKEIGLNILNTHSSESIYKIILRQLLNPIVYLLLFSTFFALLLGKWIDASVVFSVVVLNTLIGFIQEYRANHVMRALAAMIPYKTTVVRQEGTHLICSSQVAVGDIIILQAGDKIPADVRLFATYHFQCNESLLTGESLPVYKNTLPTSEHAPISERHCMAFSGTYVTAGTAMGVVVSTGLRTEFGKIAKMIEDVQPLETPLFITLKKIASWITIDVLIVGILLFIVGYLRGYPLFDSALSAVALAVAAIPEGLPAIITITSAIAVKRMAQKSAIVRQASAIEALGSTTIICTDKTGTLTYNEMTVQHLWTPQGSSLITGVGFFPDGVISSPSDDCQQANKKLLTAAILCNDSSVDESDGQWTSIGDPTEIALLVAGKKGGLSPSTIRAAWPRLDSIPFESERRLMATLHRSPNGKGIIFLKGAPEEILCRCHQLHLMDEVTRFAHEGMRVLAVAQREHHADSLLQDSDLEQPFELLGWVAMVDPPRKEAYQALKCCYQAGILVKMITGDHPITAAVIGRDLGIPTDYPPLTGADLDLLNEEQWPQIALTHHIFARTSPAHKLKLVSVLQKLGHVVAMTGDGVNDGPALKRADIGIAMGIKGTAVAKEAAGMILADDHFASIEQAIEEGRRVYDNLIKAFAFAFPTSLAQALVVFISVLFFPVHNHTPIHPILPVQILWINLIVAVALALPLAFEVAEPDIMTRAPRKKNSAIFTPFVVIRIFSVALIMACGTIGIFFWKYRQGVAHHLENSTALTHAQTMAVTTIVFFQIFYLFSCRSIRHSVLKMGFFSNPILLTGVTIVLICQAIFVYAPFMHPLFQSASLSWTSWILSAIVALSIFPIIALEKKCNRSHK